MLEFGEEHEEFNGLDLGKNMKNTKNMFLCSSK